MTDSYRQSLQDAKAELEANLIEEDVLRQHLRDNKTRSERLRKTVDSLSTLLGEIGTSQEIGLTDAIRELLKSQADNWLSALLVRHKLREKEFPIDDYKQPLAVIHTTLKRLQDQGQVTSDDFEGKSFYRWDAQQTGVGVTDADIPF